MKRLYYDLRWKIEMRWHQLRRWWHMRHLKPGQCEQPGCHDQGEPCYVDDTGVPDCHYCDRHMAAEGFCRGCRAFWGGVESFEFAHDYGGIEGYCENCSDEINRELDSDYDSYDDDWYRSEVMGYSADEIM